MEHGLVAADSPTFWIIISGLLFLIAAIEYVYSGKNLKRVAYMTMLGATVALLVAAIEKWHGYLSVTFLGRHDALGVPYQHTDTGWGLIFHAWPLWLGPVIFFSAMSLFIAWRVYKKYFAFTYKPSKKTDVTPVEIEVTPTIHKVTGHLEYESLKEQYTLASERLAHAIRAREDAEEKVKEMRKQIKTLAVEGSSDDVKTELANKNVEEEGLRDRIEEQELDIRRLETIIDDLLREG